MASYNNNLQRHETADRIKWCITFLLTVVFIVAVVFSALDWWTDKGPSTWGKRDAEKEEQIDDEASGGLLLPETVEGDGISLLTAVIPVEKYAENGISPIAVSAVTVSVKNPYDYFTYKWSLSGSVTSAIQLSATTGTSVNVSALVPFANQMTLTCGLYVDSESSPRSTATCTVDYKQRFSYITVNGTMVTDGETIELSTLLGSGTTIQDVLNSSSLEIKGTVGVGSVASTVTGTIGVELYGQDSDPSYGTLGNSMRGFLEIFNDLDSDGILCTVAQNVASNGSADDAVYLQSLLSGSTKDITFTVNWVCGDESGKVTFYLNFSDSLFAGFAAGNVQLDQSGIIL